MCYSSYINGVLLFSKILKLHFKATHILKDMERIFWIAWAYLYSCLVKFCDSGEFFPYVDVGVVRLGEGLFQLLQLFLREGCPVSPSRRGRARGRGPVTATQTSPTRCRAARGAAAHAAGDWPGSLAADTARGSAATWLRLQLFKGTLRPWKHIAT